MKKSKILYFVLLLAVVLGGGLAACSKEAPPHLEDAAVSSGVYVLTARHSGLVLDLPGASPEPGIQLWQYARNNTKAQQWQVESVGSGYVKITSLVNGLALDASATAPSVDGAKVSLWQYVGKTNQQWQLVVAEGSYYFLVNRASGGVLDVKGVNQAPQTLIQTWTRTGSPNQHWRFEKVGGSAPTPTPTPSSNYQSNLKLLQGATVRNRNLDNSAYRTTAMNNLPTGNSSPLLGSRSDYLGLPGGSPELGFPVKGVGTFRTACEFSHFGYDDPLVHPNKPGAAHLHMFWGNTDVNAYSTYNTLKDSGSSTCNGMELNRSGYWAPALFDDKGNVRVPERIIVYYKGYGPTRNKAQVYPPGAAMVVDDIVHRTPYTAGGTKGIYGDTVNFMCTDQYRGDKYNLSDTMPACVGDNEPGKRKVLEMHVKFPTCLVNTAAPQDPKSWQLAKNGDWYYSDCQGGQQFPHIHYIIAYPLEAGDNTAGWYLSSDIDSTTRQRTKTGGSSIHADWWGGWHPGINKEWIDNCVKLSTDRNNDGQDDVAHSCGFGYLTDGGPSDNNPYPGRALKFRQQYTGPIKVAASTLYRELCPGGSAISTATAAAYCRPAPMKMTMSGGAVINHDTDSADHAAHSDH
jgi:hypothetical protein